LEHYELLSASLDLVNEGLIIANMEQGVIISNANARLMLELYDEGAVGWKVADLLRGNDHLINAYYQVENGEETQQQLLSTTLMRKKGNRKESLAVNFRVHALETSKGGTGDILILIQPIPKLL